MLSITLTKHDLKLLKQSSSRNMNVLFKRKIIVTEHFTDSFRFDLELKMNTEFSASQQNNIIDEVTLFMK